MEQKKKKPWLLLPIAAVAGLVAGVAISFIVGTVYKNLQVGDGTYNVGKENGYTGVTGEPVEMEGPDAEIVNYAKRSAVTVLGKVDGAEFGIGSGTIVADRNGFYYVLTNNHVVDEMDEVYLNFYDLKNAQTICTVVDTNAKEDIALIKVDKIALRAAVGTERFDQLTVARFGDSSKIEVGNGIFLLGNPYSAVFEHTVTVGIVGGLNKELTLDGDTRPYMLVDAAMYFGNSGGGAYNFQGELIGVSGAKITVDGVDHMNLVLYGNTAKSLIEQWLSNEN